MTLAPYRGGQEAPRGIVTLVKVRSGWVVRRKEWGTVTLQILLFMRRWLEWPGDCGEIMGWEEHGSFVWGMPRQRRAGNLIVKPQLKHHIEMSLRHAEKSSLASMKLSLASIRFFPAPRKCSLVSRKHFISPRKRWQLESISWQQKNAPCPGNALSTQETLLFTKKTPFKQNKFSAPRKQLPDKYPYTMSFFMAYLRVDIMIALSIQ